MIKVYVIFFYLIKNNYFIISNLKIICFIFYFLTFLASHEKVRQNLKQAELDTSAQLLTQIMMNKFLCLKSSEKIFTVL